MHCARLERPDRRILDVGRGVEVRPSDLEVVDVGSLILQLVGTIKDRPDTRSVDIGKAAGGPIERAKHPNLLVVS
jgi:hypothetical protein